MKIAVNTRLLLTGRLDGIGRFADETLRIITASHPEHQFVFYFDRKPDPHFIYNSNVTPVVVPPQARHPLLFLAWFEASLPLHFLKSKPDLFLFIGIKHDLEERLQRSVDIVSYRANMNQFLRKRIDVEALYA